jgi:PAS domain S-box-containing protein
MVRKSLAQQLDTLEKRWQELQERAGAWPEVREGLEAAFREVSQAIGALRAAQEAGLTPPAASPAHCETILSNIFNAIPDLLTVIDRDHNIVMSNWHWPEVPAEFLRPPLKCYRVYHRRDRPCGDCHVLKVFATGQPQKVERTNDFDGRVLEFSVFPILDESGQVILVTEHVRDIQERHLAEKALRESEERFRAVFDYNPVGIAMSDLTGRFLQSNHAYQEIVGYTDEELRGLTFQDLTHPEDLPENLRLVEELQSGKRRHVSLEKRYLRKDGTIRLVQMTVNLLRDAQEEPQYLLGTIIDITARKQAEEALKESEERFRAIFETAQDSIFIKDRSLSYTQVNPAMERLFGCPAAEIFGKSDEDLFGEEAAAHIRESDLRVLHGEVVRETHTKPVQGVPTAFHIIKVPLRDDTGEVVGLCGIARDITDLKRAEAALRESEERFRSLFKYAPDAYLLMDLQGNFLDVNRAYEELTGYAREELIGKNLPLINDRQKSLVSATFEQAVNGQPLRPLELSLTSKDGRELVVEGKAMPLQFKGQRLVLAIGRDITARKRAEEELSKNHLELQETAQRLEQSRNMLQLIIESIPVRVFWKDRDLRYLGCNTLFALDAGFNQPEQLLGKDDFAMGWREQAQLYGIDDRQVMESRRPKMNIVEPQTTPAGAKIWLKTSKVPLQMPNGEVFGVLGVYEDITTHKQAEEALRESEKRFRDITENAAEWVWEVDAQGKYLYSSPVVEQLLGYKPEEVLDKYFYDLFIPEEREELKQAALAAFAAKQPFSNFLNPNLHKNGQIVWLSTSGIPILDEQGNLLGYRGADIDISERREAEELSRNLIAKSPVGIYLIQNGKFQRANQWFFAISGYSEDELLHLKPLELIHPEDREATRENAVKMLKGLSSVPYEYRTITKGGEARWIMETVTTIQYKGERAALGYFMDITERKQLENQLLQAQKMEAVGRLAGGVAHDFNNLLMTITGYGELMRAKVLKDDPLHEHLENMLKASDRAAALTQQLLTFSRRQIVHPQVVDLSQVVLDLEPMLRRLIGEDLELEITTDPGPVAVKADPGHLGQIIMNLVVNARDAMPRGGRLSLKTAPVEVKGSRPTRFGPVPPGAYVMLMVRDTGVGMDEAIQAHIFEPFFTTKEPGKGTGLGLSTVYGIVRHSEGYIDLTSKPGAGSTFTIYLPRLTAITAPPKKKIPLTASFRGEETILLVEDEDILRTLLAKFLRLYGYTVLEARHGGEALLLCERHPGPIHLMVTDVVMPQMSGRELADRLAPLRPAMKVVYMSGYTDDSMVHYDVGDLSVPFLQKPFKPIELVRQVHAILHPSGRP